jgi:large subunit ribosomal protein L29
MKERQTMKKNELQQATVAELNTKLEEAYQELFNLRFQRATGKLANTARFGQVKKDIARIKTYLRQRELAGN